VKLSDISALQSLPVSGLLSRRERCDETVIGMRKGEEVDDERVRDSFVNHTS
jgi:hypothetical protein